MKKLTTWIPLAIFAAFGIVQAADQYRPNPYTGKPDNIGTYVNVSAQYRSKFTQISASAAKGGVNFTSLSSYYKKASHSQYSAHTQNQLNNKVGLAKFTNNSTYTAGHIRSVSPYGGHPAAGSNRQVQYNNAGTPAGAVQLNYSGGKLGVTTTSPTALVDIGAWTGKPSDIDSSNLFLNVAGDFFAGNTGTTTGRFRVSSNLNSGFLSWNGYYNGVDAKSMDSTKPYYALRFDGLNDLMQFRRGAPTAGAVTQINLMVIKGSTGNVGIGESSPASRLTVKGAGTTTGGNILVTDSAGSAKVNVLDSGLTYFSNSGGLPYGQMYSNTSTTITVGASGTWYEVDTGATDFTAGRLKNVTQSDHYLVAPTAGDYLINAAASFGTTTAGDEIALSVMVNGTASATCHGHATVVTATTTVPSSCVTILSLAANDQVSLAVQNHSAARNITLSHSQLSIVHVGSP